MYPLQSHTQCISYTNTPTGRLATIVGVTGVQSQHRLHHLLTAAPPITVVLIFLK